MQILVLNGSPRPHGNTAAMVEAFRKGAEENGHVVTVVNVCQKKIAGCLACEYCHQEGSGHERQCVQKDDMQEVYPLLDEAEIIVLASPVYYHGFSGQLQCAINRIYALDKPKKLKKAALILSSGSRTDLRRNWRSSINLAEVWHRTHRRLPLPCLFQTS